MENIICDTTIWYDIAEGKIKPEEISKLKLIGTALNIIEIASTPHLFDNFELVKLTIKALQKHHFIINSRNPFDHFISIFDSSFKPNDEYVVNLLNDFEKIDTIDNCNDLSLEDWDIVFAKTGARKDYIRRVVNDALLQSQTFIKDNHLKKNYSSNSYKDSWKPFFIFLISEYYRNIYNEEIIIAKNDMNWNRLDFFITAWDEYFKHLEIEDGSKFKRNDWYDLWNLVYVQPECKYWTSEKRSWAKLLKENKDLKPYMFNIN